MIREDIDRVIDQIIYDVVHNKTKFTETYRKELINLIVDKLTVMDRWDIRNKYLEGYNKTVHLVLADPLGIEHRKKEKNGREAVAEAQLQHTIKEIKNGTL